MEKPFLDRREAGQLLAARLLELEPLQPGEAVVLALPRGGVPVGYEVAAALHAPLAAFVVRKVGVPGHPELAMGAIASGGIHVVNDDVVRYLGIPPEAIEQVAARERVELERREREYGSNGTIENVRAHTAVLVDDGLATGSTMRAAVLAVRRLEPRRVIVAVPVGAPDTCELLARDADRVVCLRMPEPFQAVGLWYRRFDQTSDEEVRALLDANRDHVKKILR
jgi:putative phosphoribosyl transferase